jgi:hypothetical protein
MLRVTHDRKVRPSLTASPANDPAVAGHHWLAWAAQFCLVAIEAMGDDPYALAIGIRSRRLPRCELLPGAQETAPVGSLQPCPRSGRSLPTPRGARRATRSTRIRRSSESSP